jgi:hypothetical protein
MILIVKKKKLQSTSKFNQMEASVTWYMCMHVEIQEGPPGRERGTYTYSTCSSFECYVTWSHLQSIPMVNYCELMGARSLDKHLHTFFFSLSGTPRPSDPPTASDKSILYYVHAYFCISDSLFRSSHRPADRYMHPFSFVVPIMSTCRCGHHLIIFLRII